MVEPFQNTSELVMLLLLLSTLGCISDPVEAVSDSLPVLEDVRQIVPSDGLPAEVAPQDANNNLDIAWHDGRLFLAFRTAPTHFASKDAELYVVSTTDEETWRYEGRFHLGTDLREPQLVSWQGELHFFFAVLGDNPIEFEPQGTRHTVWRGSGQWDELEEAFDPTFIPWRIKELDGQLYMTGYTGGENVYNLSERQPIEIHWLRSHDLVSWEPVVPGQPVVLSGGGSESDFAFLEDGSVVAVVRNEAGDADGYGSKICTAPADDLGTWTCSADPKKYDSPLVFRANGTTWLIGRRNVTEDGHYDLMRDDLDADDRYLTYQVEYWNEPKRCSLWSVDEATRSVTWVLDLPSAGDTCFPEVVPLEDAWLLYNYSSDPAFSERVWIEGQTMPTQIYRHVLRFD